MEQAEYERMAELERDHWWFAARRRIVDALLRRARLPDRAAILEVGCGSGGNLELLARHGEVHAIEMEATARERAAARGIARAVDHARLPDITPFPGQRFDVIVMLDVLEHIEQDVAALERLRASLAPGGRFVITVPAFPWLWSAHDEALHHQRRYTRRTLQAALVAAGLRASYLSHFNVALFPVVAAVRLAGRCLGRAGSSDLSMPARPINAALREVFAAERCWIGRLRSPFGVSLAAIAAPVSGATAFRGAGAIAETSS